MLYSLIWWCGVALLLRVLLYVAVFVWIHFIRPSTSWSQFRGEWGVVTGSSVGTGEAFARALAKRGINVVLVARSADKLERLAKELRSAYSVKVVVFPMDFCSAGNSVLCKDGPVSCEPYSSLWNALKGMEISVLVNNVGGGEPGMLPLDYWQNADPRGDEVIRLTNSLPAFTMIRMLLPQMLQRHKGRIINITSASADYGVLMANYSSDKAKINVFSAALTEELLSQSVQVQAVMLGAVSTPALLNAPTNLHVASPTRIAEDTLKKFWAFGSGTCLVPYWFHNVEVTIVKLLPEALALRIFHIIALSLKKELYAGRKQALEDKDKANKS